MDAEQKRDEESAEVQLEDLSKLTTVPISKIQDAKRRIKGTAVRTPLVALNESDTSSRKIYLKLENLQPIGSFKLRGAYNAMQCLPQEQLCREGVYTSSAGNFAQGLSWSAKEMNVRCSVIVPESAPRTKLDAIQRHGGGQVNIQQVPYDAWWQVMCQHSYPGMKGIFVHPVSNVNVIAGNGTIGLEILEDLPDVDAVIIPYGGGGLSSGIASAIKATKPSVKIYACEVDTAAPLSASLVAGQPSSFAYSPSFVDGMGSKCILPEMWTLVSSLIDDSLVVSVPKVAEAVKFLMERNRIIAEGAGAAPVAAARAGLAGDGNIVCVVSGGNIDNDKLMSILQGQVP
ncbi:L-threonine ammonia-lyase-like [Ptychodera flava]|uniref:L-threonine ammonia-lyase-like n=1 Tax=Ptychodera flava TaxID=63121 RepID=UPI00396A094F